MIKQFLSVAVDFKYVIAFHVLFFIVILYAFPVWIVISVYLLAVVTLLIKLANTKRFLCELLHWSILRLLFYSMKIDHSELVKQWLEQNLMYWNFIFNSRCYIFRRSDYLAFKIYYATNHTHLN